MRHKVSSKELIIECALLIIKEEGLETLSSRYLSKKAEVGLGTIYNYFESRDALLEEVFIVSWTKTKEKLIRTQNEEIDLKEKMTRLLDILSRDIQARSGLGTYITQNRKENERDIEKRFPILKDIIDIFILVLQESPMYQNDSTEELHMTALWILMSYISLSKLKIDMEAFHSLLIKKLL